MDYFLIIVTALLASMLTFFSGFGLGTILTPVFAIFFPIPLAVAMTAIVHVLNNLFKLLLVGRHARMEIILRFGLPAIGGAILGAALLGALSNDEVLFVYKMGGRTFSVFPVNLIVGLIMATFAVLELFRWFRELQFSGKAIYAGGVISGFFGGLSGHQGALRSAFLIKAGLSKEAFIATGVSIAVLIDFARIPIYMGKHFSSLSAENLWLILAAVLAAFTGAFIGNRLLRKMTLGFLQVMVSVMILVLAVLLIGGVLGG